MYFWGNIVSNKKHCDFFMTGFASINFPTFLIIFDGYNASSQQFICGGDFVFIQSWDSYYSHSLPKLDQYFEGYII